MASAVLLLKDREQSESASYIIRKRSMDAGRFTLEGSRPGNVIYIHANIKCMGSGRFELIVSRTAQICNHMAESTEVLLYRTDGCDATTTQVLTTQVRPPLCGGFLLVDGVFVRFPVALVRNARIPRTRRHDVGTTLVSSPLERFSFGRLTECARLNQPRKVARPQKNQGDAFRGWLCDLTPRTASPERIGESSRNSGSDCAAPGGNGKAYGQMCVTIQDGERARGARLCDTQRPVREKGTKHRHHNTGLHCTRARRTYTDTREHESPSHSFTHSFTQVSHSSTHGTGTRCATRNTTPHLRSSL